MGENLRALLFVGEKAEILQAGLRTEANFLACSQ
jgi:hypothetical protein